jgi:hypothetical protein
MLQIPDAVGDAVFSLARHLWIAEGDHTSNGLK